MAMTPTMRGTDPPALVSMFNQFAYSVLIVCPIGWVRDYGYESESDDDRYAKNAWYMVARGKGHTGVYKTWYVELCGVKMTSKADIFLGTVSSISRMACPELIRRAITRRQTHSRRTVMRF